MVFVPGPWLLPALNVLISSVYAIPSPASIGSDLTILLHNDLYGNLSTHDTAVIVLSALQTQEEARSRCEALGEFLWTPPASLHDPTSRLDLAYIGYVDPSSKDLFYWTTNSISNKCQAISQDGFVSKVSCRARLPALCTQSAPLSTTETTNTSLRWQTGITTASQTIVGYRDKLSFRFEGLRYALQPVRFTYSTLYNGTANASALSPGPQCIQSGCNYTTCTEDCLFLNIWTPYLPASPYSSESAKKLKPIMFWIHGGAFTSGTGTDATFDGGNMASRGDVVVVTINYRLSTLGFLALDDGVTNGNFGLADQITALDWVHAHIRDFGGDPERVTIFGQSAGAASVRALLASPKAIGKYRSAIPMSNLAGSSYATTYSQYYSISEEVAVAADPILNDTGCANATSQLECLRAYDAFDLVSLPDTARYLVVDGSYLTTSNLALTGTGPAAYVPVMMGIMRDDGAAFVSYPTTANLTESLVASDFANTSTNPAVSNAFPVPFNLYPTNATLAVFNATARLATDAELRCLDYATAYSAVLHSVFPIVYFYEFNRSYQMPSYDPNTPVCDAPKSSEHAYGDSTKEYFKCHSGELFYVFGNLVRMGYQLRDAGDIPFSQFALDAWTSFARTQDPNPDIGFLDARGFVNTLNEIRSAGRWTEVRTKGPTFKNLGWPLSRQLGFAEAKQCDVLGYPLGFYG